jgi:hypothetical protein
MQMTTFAKDSATGCGLIYGTLIENMYLIIIAIGGAFAKLETGWAVSKYERNVIKDGNLWAYLLPSQFFGMQSVKACVDDWSGFLHIRVVIAVCEFW